MLPKQEASSSFIPEWEAFIYEELEGCISYVYQSRIFFSIVRPLFPKSRGVFGVPLIRSLI